MNFSSILRSYNGWKKYRRTYAELQRLSPRELEDVGLTPGTIRDAAHRVSKF